MVKFASFLRRLFPLTMALLLLISGTSGSLDALNDGTAITATKREYSFDNDRILFGGYCVNKNDLQSVQYADEAGLDFLVGRVDEAYLDECEKYGIGIIAQGYNASPLYVSASEENIQKWFSLNSETYKYHPALWGDDLIDEPNSQLFDTISQIVDSYRENVEGKISLVNLFPMYANEQQLGNSSEISRFNEIFLPSHDFSNTYIDSYKRHVSEYISKIDTDFISFDVYPMKIRKTTREPFTDLLWLRNLDVLAEACRETQRDLWVIVQAAGNIETPDGVMRYCDEVGDISQQVYASLAFGAKSIIYACYESGWWDKSSHMLDSEGKRTDTYYSVQSVNSDVAAFSELFGEYVYTSTFMVNPSLVAGQEYGYLVNENKSEKPIITSCADGLLVGTFRSKLTGERAYIVVNMEELGNNSDASAVLTVPYAESLTVYQGGEATQHGCSTVSLHLAPGEGVFITA